MPLYRYVQYKWEISHPEEKSVWGVTDPTPKRNLVKEWHILINLDGSHPEENFSWEDSWIMETNNFFKPMVSKLLPPTTPTPTTTTTTTLTVLRPDGFAAGKKKEKNAHPSTKEEEEEEEEIPYFCHGVRRSQGRGKVLSLSLSLLSPFQATLFPFSPSSYSVHGSSGRRKYKIRQRLRNLRSRWIAIWKDGWILVMPSFPFSQRGGGERGRNKQKKEDSRGREGGWLWSRKKGKEEEEEESIKHEAWLGEVCCFLIRSPFSLFLLGVQGPWDRHGILSPYIPSPNDSALQHGKKVGKRK